MKRFLLFLLLGPAVGFAVFEIREVLSGRIIGGFIGFLMGLPIAYWFGLLPSLIMWGEDWFLEDKIGLAEGADVGRHGLHRQHSDVADLDVGPDPAAADTDLRHRRRVAGTGVFVAVRHQAESRSRWWAG